MQAFNHDYNNFIIQFQLSDMFFFLTINYWLTPLIIKLSKINNFPYDFKFCYSLILLISGSGGLPLTLKRRVTVYVCHTVFKTKPERDFGISCPLLYCLKSYLNGRQQVTVVNGVHPPILTGIPQVSVLGPTLFAMLIL